jgi:predicted O-methyltransferase YrrM
MLIDIDEAPIPTWTEPATLDYCRDIAQGSDFMVESGTYMGASARAMLARNPHLHLWCVDKFMVFGTEKVTRMFLSRWITGGQCEIIVGDMDNAGEMLAHMRGKIDAIWVDDGHAEEDVRRDIRNALPLLRPGGILFGHDFDVPNNDVARGVLSMLPAAEITHPVHRVWQWRKP